MSHDLKIRNRILEAAEEQFFKHGCSSVTMEALAEQLGMSKKTLYQYFQSKEELIAEVTHIVMANCDRNLEETMNDPELDFVDKFKQMIYYITRIWARMSRAMIDDLRKNTPELWKQVDAQRRERITRDFMKVISEGIQSGVFRKDLDPHLFIVIYAKANEAVMNPDVLAELPYSADQVFENFAKVFFEGILTDGARVNYRKKHGEVVEN